MLFLLLAAAGGLLLGFIGGFRTFGLIAALALSPLVIFLAGVWGLFAYYFAIVFGAFLGQVMIKIVP